MSNRDRNGQRLARQAREPAWTDWSAGQDDAGGDDASIDGPSRDLPAWSDEAPASRRRDPRRRDATDAFDAGSPRAMDPAPDTGGRRRLPELSRTLSSSRTRRREVFGAPEPEPEFADAQSDTEWWQEPNEWQSQDVPDRPSTNRRQPRRSPAGRHERQRYGDRPTRARQSRPAPSLTVPPVIAQAAFFQDRLLLGITGAIAASLALMAAIVGSRIGEMPTVVVLHLNAAGVPDVWGTREALWRLPLAAVMLSIMNIVAAAFLLDRNAFVARFLVASSLLVNVLAWIAVLLIFW